MITSEKPVHPCKSVVCSQRYPSFVFCYPNPILLKSHTHNMYV